MKQASLEKLEERETWHKIVVKVIVWRDGSVKKGLVEAIPKLTMSEWNTYHLRTLKINVNKSRDKVLADLRDTLKKIKQNNGLEEKPTKKLKA